MANTKISASLLEAAQTSITSVGTLSSLAVTGQVAGGSYNVGGTAVIDSGRNLVNMGNVNGAAGVFGSLTVDNFILNGTTLALSSGDMTLDVAGNIILDADGGFVAIKDGGTEIGNLGNSSSDFVITSSVQDKDIIFKGNDNGSVITALTLDMSAAGAATFNSTVNGMTIKASASGDRWGCIPEIASNGVMEVGRYIDFHATDGDTSDYGARLDFDGTSLIIAANTTTTGAATFNGTVSAATLTATNGVLNLDDNGSHNGIINSPASLFVNIDSDGTNTGELFAIAKDRTSTSGGTELFRVQEDGNITQTGPTSADFLIKAQTDNASLTLQAGASDTGAEGAFVNFRQNTTYKWQMGMNTDNSFRWYNYATSSEDMQILPTGQVGVSSRPGFRFGANQLQGNAGSSGGGYPTIGYNISFTSTSGNFGTMAADTSWRIDMGNNNRLQVHSRSSASAVSSGAIYTAGPYVALNGTTWTGGSDERLKENVSTITGADAVAKVKAMRPVNYSWKHDSESVNQLGFIAQEMLSVVPEVVDVPENETDPITKETLMWGITYDRLIPVLTAALQEALTRVETLEAKVQTLENN